MEYTLDEIKQIVRELLKWDGQIEDLLVQTHAESGVEYNFDCDTAYAKLLTFANS